MIRSETAAVAALAKVGGRSGFGSTVRVVADRATRSLNCANSPAVVPAASEQTRIGLVLADAEFDSERNHSYIRHEHWAQSVIRAKRGKKPWSLHRVRAQMLRPFPRRLYLHNALVEILFSSVKRKLSARVPGRSLRTQMN
jgi:hypothetical protein